MRTLGSGITLVVRGVVTWVGYQISISLARAR